jgi:hypothetical protein
MVHAFPKNSPNMADLAILDSIAISGIRCLHGRPGASRVSAGLPSGVFGARSWAGVSLPTNTINERALRRISTLVDWRQQITQPHITPIAGLVLPRRIDNWSLKEVAQAVVHYA